MISHEDAERNSLEDGKLIESTILAAAMLAVCERRGVRALGVLTAQTLRGSYRDLLSKYTNASEIAPWCMILYYAKHYVAAVFDGATLRVWDSLPTYACDERENIWKTAQQSFNCRVQIMPCPVQDGSADCGLSSINNLSRFCDGELAVKESRTTLLRFVGTAGVSIKFFFSAYSAPNHTPNTAGSLWRCRFRSLSRCLCWSMLVYVRIYSGVYGGKVPFFNHLNISRLFSMSRCISRVR